MGDYFSLQEFVGTEGFICTFSQPFVILLLTTYSFLSWDAVHCVLGISFPFKSDLIMFIALFWIEFSINLCLLPFVLYLTETVLRKLY